MSRGRGPRTFDPVKVGNLETDAWAAYYRHEWRSFLKAQERERLVASYTALRQAV